MKKETRMYYDCPIEAMYMAANFGVELYCETEEGDEGVYDDVGKKYHFNECELFTADLEMMADFLELMKNWSRKIYITKESEHIFEPQDCDIDAQGYEYENTFDMQECNWAKWHCGGLDCKEKSKTAIRNGKPFFMPKTEEL